jgi:hypothetical protein
MCCIVGRDNDSAEFRLHRRGEARLVERSIPWRCYSYISHHLFSTKVSKLHGWAGSVR